MVYGIQRLGTRPSPSITPGEYRPAGMGSGGNTYIQINNYGNNSCNNRGWACNAWANMDHHNCEDNGNSTFGKVMGWVGVGLEAAGSILSLFKKDSE